MPPLVNQKTTDPPGALPANTRFIVLGSVALLIITATFFSGHSTKKSNETAAGVLSGPNPNQLSAFKQMLERQSREVEEAKKQTDALRLATEQAQEHSAKSPGQYYGVPEGPRVANVPPVDPFEQKRREREETAPFASNIALRAAPSEAAERITRQNTLPLSVSEPEKIPIAEPRAESGRRESSKNAGSGKYLPEKEGSLYRIYEGTFIETTLVNRLDGSFTGPVKCSVSKDVRSRSGEALLIPKGSEVFGEARRVESAGQARLAVSFKRLLLANGYSIDLENVPGLSEQGETGLKDKTNNHYLRYVRHFSGGYRSPWWADASWKRRGPVRIRDWGCKLRRRICNHDPQSLSECSPNNNDSGGARGQGVPLS